MILFLAIIWLLKNQLSKVNVSDWNSLTVYRPSFLVVGFLLVFVNWFLEWKKWLLTLKVLQLKVSFSVEIKSFFAGIATGLITPNMLGNFIGRIFYFQRRHRVPIILMTLLSNFSQFFASIFFGFIALFVLYKTPIGMSVNYYILGVGLLVLLSLVVYFFFEFISSSFIIRLKLFQKMLLHIVNAKGFRLNVMLLSLLRHFVFTIQFWLILNSFIRTLSLESFFWIWQIFLWTTLIPSLWFGKLMIRESIALLVLTAIGLSELEIIVSSVLLWFINLAFPAILSIFICKRKEIRG
ncbi:MAG: flippase-like domain-containing protein [Flavobacteriia bacterium]|nr:flippase-like domain-containing protein [Flavobacteriia bacterium]